MDDYTPFVTQLKGFVIAFFTTLIIVLFMIWVAVGTLGGDINTQNQNLPANQTAEIPKIQNRINIILALTESDSYDPEVFILLGFLPDNGQIAVTLLPPKSQFFLDGSWVTINQMFLDNGMNGVLKGLSTVLEIPIEGQAILTNQQLCNIVDYGGYVNYQVTAGLNYPHNQRQVVLSVGNHLMDGRKIMDILAYPAYDNGEQERSDRGTMLVTNILNQYMSIMQTDRGEELVKTFLNNSLNNMSITDYLDRKDAINFLTMQKIDPVTAVYIDGELSGDYKTFTLSTSCISRLQLIYSR